jgi:mono/diheme cytochrome c family protein
MKLNLTLSTMVILAAGVSPAAFSQTEASSAQGRSGKEIFTQKCETCHGSDGAGTPVGRGLKVADLRSAFTQKKSDADLSRVVSEGKNSMPAFGNDLSADQVKAVVSCVRSLRPRKK